jgi:hypothetical protein
MIENSPVRSKRDAVGRRQRLTTHLREHRREWRDSIHINSVDVWVAR